MPRRGGWALFHADRLAVRLAVMLSLALAPVGALAVWQTASLARDAEAQGRAALVRRTADAVSGQRAMIESLFISARTLAPIAARRSADAAECRQVVTQFVEASPLVVFAGLMTADGAMSCTSNAAVREFGDDPRIRERLLNPAPLVTRHDIGPISGLPVVVASLPHWEDAVFVGYIVISIKEGDLGLIRRDPTAGGPRAALLLNAHGDVVHVRPGERPMAADLPADAAVYRAAVDRVIRGLDEATPTRSAAGEALTLTSATLIPGQLFALGVWPSERTPGAGSLGRIASWLVFPGLMWAVSLLVAYVTIFRMVVRHIRQMNGAMRRFALGARDDPPMQPGDAPAEIRELMSTLNRMSRIIAQDEARLTASVNEKTQLLREIHHRVKNNFQLISSVMNLQLRKVTDPDARQVLRSLQDRVLGLATIHRAYYEADSVAEVRADRLLGSILAQLAVGFGPVGRAPRVETDLDPVLLSPDQIVPLAVILTELATEALREGGGWLHLALEAEPEGMARMTLTRPAAPRGPAAAAETEIRSQLLETLTHQLDGRLDHGTLDGPGPGPAAKAADGAPYQYATLGFRAGR